jgi:hypothetical protein
MLEITQVLTRLKIRTDSRHSAVQDVRDIIETSANPISAAQVIITNLGVSDYNTCDATEARMTAQRLVDEAIVLGSAYDPNKALEKAATRIAAMRISDPWFFTKPTHSSVVSTTETREGVNIEVLTTGKLKKGGKQILAKALYEKNNIMSNKELTELFMKELDMSLAGARTYVFNCRKK